MGFCFPPFSETSGCPTVSHIFWQQSTKQKKKEKKHPRAFGPESAVELVHEVCGESGNGKMVNRGFMIVRRGRAGSGGSKGGLPYFGKLERKLTDVYKAPGPPNRFVPLEAKSSTSPNGMLMYMYILGGEEPLV